ncbi:MAG: hypothetical protein K8L91_17695 [Anaerolineae bacterium]|nr:hypothetical protein [Anaerolineae bacterium]
MKIAVARLSESYAFVRWIFLTGLEADVLPIAWWVQENIAAQHPLRFYWLGHWTNTGVEITPELVQIGLSEAKEQVHAAAHPSHGISATAD